MFVPPTLFFSKLKRSSWALPNWHATRTLLEALEAVGGLSGQGTVTLHQFSLLPFFQNILLYFAALFDSCIENSTNN
jgi:hypothetical protein